VLEVAGRGLRSHSIRAALSCRIGFVSDDRRGSGLIESFNVAQNLVLSSLQRLSKLGFLRRHAQRSAAEWATEAFGIKAATIEAPILSLSGGNQQKVLIGRALLRNPTLLLLDDPTRGIDVGAKADIYQLIRSQTDTGLAVLVASNELLELIGWCDRLIVLRAGRVVAELGPNAPAALVVSLASATPLEDAS
jgi:ribose transport system ATP-binding protein